MIIEFSSAGIASRSITYWCSSFWSAHHPSRTSAGLNAQRCAHAVMRARGWCAGLGLGRAEVEAVLESVGFRDDMRSTSIASLSGGWKMKLALGGAPPPWQAAWFCMECG